MYVVLCVIRDLCTLRKTLAEFGINIFNALICQSYDEMSFLLSAHTIGTHKSTKHQFSVLCVELAEKMFSLACKKIPNIQKLQHIKSPNAFVAIRNCSIVEPTTLEEEKGRKYCIIVKVRLVLRDRLNNTVNFGIVSQNFVC